MIIGDPSVFAVESGFTKAYKRLSFRALGFFVIHVGACRYDLFSPKSSLQHQLPVEELFLQFLIAR